MNIREQEERLLARWSKKKNAKTFVWDGVPHPDTYTEQAPRILFVLKECNLGRNYGHSFFNLREQMVNDPDGWWKNIVQWGFALQHIHCSDPSWSQIAKSKNNLREGLAPFAFMQLNKTPGLGSVSDKKLRQCTEADADEIREQVSLYAPNIIVACGTGHFVKSVLCPEQRRRTTPRGIGFWPIAGASDGGSHIIDFCHPSNRTGKKVWPALVFGLLDSCRYVVEA